MAIQSGKAIREYDVLGLIRASSSHGDLYAARHRMLCTPCAIREIPSQLQVDKVACDWMLREARVFSEFNHPSVSRLLQCFEEDEKVYLVYDFIDGTLLSSILKRGPLPPSQAVKIALAIGNGLEAAHKQPWNLGESAGFGIPHGNLSGDVITVGGSSVVKMFDFSPIGSVHDTLSDRHALGRLLARMLTGDSQWDDSDCMGNLPPLPATLKDLIETLINAVESNDALEFAEFLPQLEDISLAYDEGGLVPRSAVDLSMEMTSPLPIACHGARKRLYVGDMDSHRVGKYNYNGELEQLYDGLESTADGLVFMPGYGLFVFGKKRGEVSLISMAGQMLFHIEGYDSLPDETLKSGFEETIVGAARLNRGTFALADKTSGELLLVDAAGTVTGSIGKSSGESMKSIGPVAANREIIAVIDYEDCKVYFFNIDGVKLQTRNLADYGIEAPSGCEIDNTGNFYVTDKLTGKLVIIERNGGILEFDSLVVGEYVSLSPGDISLAENGSLIIISDPLEKILLMYDNYFYLSALEKSGGCNRCGFINPEGVARCLACEILEHIFPVPESVLAEDEDEGMSSTRAVELEDDIMYQGMIEAGEAHKVIGPLQQRLKSEPDNEEVLMLLGSALAQCPDVKPLYALELIKTASSSASSAYLLCTLCIGLGSYDCAAKFLAIFKANKGDEGQQQDLEELIEQIKGQLKTSGIPFFTKLAVLSDAEQLIDYSILFYSWILKVNPDDYGSQASLGRLYLRDHRYEEAKTHFDWMLAHNSYDVEALEVLTCMLNKDREWDDTYNLLHHFFNDPRIGNKLIAGHGKLRYNYGIALKSLGRKDEATREIARAKRLGFTPLSPEKIKNFFACHKKKELTRVVEIGDELCLEFEFFRWPDGDISRSLLWKIAGAYEKLGDIYRAMRAYRIFIQKFPNHPARSQADRTLATLALKLGKR